NLADAGLAGENACVLNSSPRVWICAESRIGLGSSREREGSKMHSPWIGEFLGTLVLLLLGTGVNAGVTLRKSYAADSGWMVITTGWALAVMCGVVVAQGFGSH